MQLELQILPVLSLVTGILVLIVPKILNYAIGIYLVLVGLAGLTGMGHM